MSVVCSILPVAHILFILKKDAPKTIQLISVGNSFIDKHLRQLLVVLDFMFAIELNRGQFQFKVK